MNSNRSNKLKKEKIFFWASDFKSNTGEGRLGRLYIEYIKHKINKKIIKISSPKNNFLNYKYIVPFTGIFICWLYFFKNKKVIYVNYLPYWNFLIFLLLPPNTLIGPITGGALFNSASKDYYIRKYIFPLLYLLSSSILKIRFKQCIFSTSLLKKYIPKDIKKISKFNFVFKAIKKTKKKYPNKKNIDFLFYYRDHTNKKTFFPFELLKKLIKQNYNIKIVGDKIYLKGITNLGYVSFGKVNSLLKKTKFTVISNENIFSFFTIDAINNNVKILIKDNQFNLLNNYKKNFIKFNFYKNDLKKIKLK